MGHQVDAVGVLDVGRDLLGLVGPQVLHVLDVHLLQACAPAAVGQALLHRHRIPAHLERVDALDDHLALGVLVIVHPGLGPAHAAGEHVPEGLALLVLGVALLAAPLGRGILQLGRLGIAQLGGDVPHLLALRDLEATHRPDQGRDAVHRHQRALGLAHQLLVGVGPLVTVEHGVRAPCLLGPVPERALPLLQLLPGLGGQFVGLEFYALIHEEAPELCLVRR